MFPDETRGRQRSQRMMEPRSTKKPHTDDQQSGSEETTTPRMLKPVLALPIVLAASLSGGRSFATPSNDVTASIGTATMTDGGTIILDLRFTDPKIGHPRIPVRSTFTSTDQSFPGPSPLDLVAPTG